MLVRPGNDEPFPQNDLAYLAFCVAAGSALMEFEAAEAAPRGTRGAVLGVLSEVPLLSDVPGGAQVDLLARVWARHDTRRVHRATLLDAAVVWAACGVAEETMGHLPTLVRSLLRTAPRRLDIRLDGWTRERLPRLYTRWWGTFDPGRLRSTDELDEYPARLREPVLDAVDLTEPDPGLLRDVAGLLCEADLDRLQQLLFGTR
jgi:hypothetical protein